MRLSSLKNSENSVALTRVGCGHRLRYMDKHIFLYWKGEPPPPPGWRGRTFPRLTLSH